MVAFPRIHFLVGASTLTSEQCNSVRVLSPSTRGSRDWPHGMRRAGQGKVKFSRSPETLEPGSIVETGSGRRRETIEYAPELRERAVRLYRESEPKPELRWLAEQLNVHLEVLRNWIWRDQAYHGERDDLASMAMLRENRRWPRTTRSCGGHRGAAGGENICRRRDRPAPMESSHRSGNCCPSIRGCRRR